MVQNLKSPNIFFTHPTSSCHRRFRRSHQPYTISTSFTSTGVLDGNSITKNYIYGPNGEDDVALVIQKYVKKVGVTITTTTTNYYYHKDHLSSPEKISNDLGAIIEEYAYTPYGATFIKNSSTSGSYIPVSVYMSTILPKIPAGNTGALYGNNRLYTGREYDKESGLYYNRARYYDPTHGRFLSRDPIGYIDDVNPYRYVGNNPIMFSDPSGMMKMILQETGLRLLKWTADAILLAASPDTAISNGDINGTYEEDMKNAKVMDNQIMHPSGEALAISFFLPGPGGKGKFIKNSEGAVLKFSEHSLQRIEKWSINNDELLETASAKTFKYTHDGVEKIGYYSEKTGVFFGTVGDKITTIFRTNSNYITNLKNLGK